MRGLAIALTFVWCGLLVGISFMEAPLKFQAPGVTTAIGVGIGKLVFTTLNRMEWVLAAAIALSLWRGRIGLRTHLIFAIPLLIIVAQSFYLLPNLHERVALIQAGITLPPSQLHLTFIGAEALKLIALIVAGSALLKNQPH